MKKVKINLDDLVSSFTFDSEGLSTEYLNIETGEIVHIPEEVARAVEDELDIEELEDWQKEIVADAEAILIEMDDNYLPIKPIESSYFHNAMVDFVCEKVKDSKVSEKLNNALSESHPMRKFKDVLHNYPDELELWYQYEDKKSKDYVLDWLQRHDIIVVE